MLHTTSKQQNYNLVTPSSPYSSCSSSSSLATSHVHNKNIKNNSSTKTINENPGQLSTSRERKAAKRKEKSRVAAQIRRNKESQTLILLQNALPISLASPSVMLEKSIVIRISGQTLFLLNNLDQVLGTKSQITTHLESQNFLGIFMNSHGQIVYVTPSIQNKLDQYHWSNLVGLPLSEVIEIQEETTRAPSSLTASKSPYSKFYHHPFNSCHSAFKSPQHQQSKLPKSGDVIKLKLSANSSISSSHASPDPPVTPRTPNSSNCRVQRSHSFSSSLSNLSLSSPSKSSVFFPLNPSLSIQTSSSLFSKHKPTPTSKAPYSASSASFLSSSSNRLFKTPIPSSNSLLNPPQKSNNSLNSLNSIGIANNSKSLLALKLGNSQSKMLRHAYSICSLYTVWCSCDIVHTNSNLHLLLLQPLSPTSSYTVHSPSSLSSPLSSSFSSSSFDYTSVNKTPSLPRNNTNSLHPNQQHYQQTRYFNNSQHHHQVTSVLDNNYNFEYISSEFSNLVGQDQQTMKSMNFLELVNINDVIGIKSVLDKVSNKYKSQAWTPIYRIQKPNGTFCLLRTLVKQNQFTQSSNSSNTMSNSPTTTSSLSSNSDQDFLLLSHIIIRISNKLPKTIKSKSKSFISKSISDFMTKREFYNFNENSVYRDSLYPCESEQAGPLLNTSSHLSAQHIYESYHDKLSEANIDEDDDAGDVGDTVEERAIDQNDRMLVVGDSKRVKKENVCPISSSSSLVSVSAISLKRKSFETSMYPSKLKGHSSINLIPEETTDPLISTPFTTHHLKSPVKFPQISNGRQIKSHNNHFHQSNRSTTTSENDEISVSFFLDDDNQDDPNINKHNSINNNSSSINNCDTSTMSNSSDDLTIHFDDVITQNHGSPLLVNSCWDDENYESHIDLLI